MHEGEVSPSWGIVSTGFAGRAGRFPLTPCAQRAQGTVLRSAPRCPRPYSLRSLHANAQHLRRKTSPVTFVQNVYSFCTRPSTLSMARGPAKPPGLRQPGLRHPIHRCSVSMSRSTSMGFAIWSFMPALWAFPRSDAKAFAVRARMGTARASARFSARIVSAD